MSKLCFITTCKSRLANLKQSLPTFAAQAETSCVVVDYDCPQGTADWVATAHPQVRVVRATDRPRFEVARARNLGAEAADAMWLCFVDSDVLLAPNFSTVVMPFLEAGNYYRPEPRSNELWGTCICHRDDFDRIEGYDDVLQGWGKDDGDLYQRLDMMGTRPQSFPGELLGTIQHDDAARVAHYDLKDHWLNASANHVYCRAKWDLMRHWRKNVPRPFRQRLYEQFRQAILAAHADGKPIELGVPLYKDSTWSCGPLEARLVYRLQKPSGNGGPPTNAANADSA